MSSSLFDLCYKYIILQALLKKNIFRVFCVFLSLPVPIICLPALTANIFSLLLWFLSLLRQHFCCIIFFQKVSQPPFVGFIFYTWEQVTQFLYSIWFATKVCKSSGIQWTDTFEVQNKVAAYDWWDLYLFLTHIASKQQFEYWKLYIYGQVWVEVSVLWFNPSFW